MTHSLQLPHRRPQAQGAFFADAGGKLIALMTGAGILVMFLVSPMVLYNLGLNYEAPGGNFVEKVHPGSWLLFIAFILAMLFSGNPARCLDAVIARQPGMLVFWSPGPR